MTDKIGDLIAVMANTVAEARHTLTVAEQRLVLWLIAQIDREDDALREYTLSVLELKEILGETSNNGRLYDQMEAACNQLQTRVLELRTGPNERTKFNWMHEVRYLDKECKIRLRFHDNLKPVLLQLRERFCQVPLKAAFKLRGGYSIRWLEMLYSRRHQGSFYMTVEQLRDWLHIAPDELQKTNHLHERAVEYPRKDLAKKSPLTFTNEPKKEGRKICGWVFTVVENKPKAAKSKAPRPAKLPPSPAPVEDSRRAEYAASLHELKSAIAGNRKSQLVGK